MDDEARSIAVLRDLLAGSDAGLGGLEAVTESSRAWRDEYAEPTIAQARAGDPTSESDAALERGRTLFQETRARVDGLQEVLSARRDAARRDLDGATRGLVATLIGASVLLIGAVVTLWWLLRRSVQRPLDRLRADADVVASGDVEHRVEPVGPEELRELAVAMEEMRTRIVDELRTAEAARAQLEASSADLARSNAELEQFAYVASHDLQEPLRKVTSFCQLLQNRYAAQLDERANQYIDFAVDGAKRMQALINDLLAFSRVGRVRSGLVDVDLDVVAAAALSNLAATIGESGARVELPPLPTVRGERALLIAVFQNLIGNGVKYRRPDVAPEVRVGVQRHDDVYEFVVTDNGIGIEPQYAERVFVIFQRLHSKEQYEGTGIGLSLCRKIVEYHGGTIWAATDASVGAAIHFTLPVPEDSPA